MAKSAWIGVLVVVMGLVGFRANPARAEDGIAVAIVYDMSGSMKEPVPDRDGKSTPKCVIANRALLGVIDRLQKFTESSKDRKLCASLLTFGSDKVHEAIPLADFTPEPFRRWAESAPQPEGGTPLGEALRAATEQLLKSKLDHRHILVITDGANTKGPDPVTVLPDLRKEMASQGTEIHIYFVAFDVEAKVFDPLKKLDVMVVGASNEEHLNMQLAYILQQKMLVEEEPAAKKP